MVLAWARNLRSNVATLAVTCGLCAGAFGLAHAQSENPFAAAVTVNGTIVTNYQVNQRFAFLTLLRAPGATPEAIFDTMVDEALQVQAARSAGVTVPPEAIEAGIAEFSGRVNLEPAEFIEALEQNGVAAETLRDFVSNGIHWREVVRQRFGPLAQISEDEIDRALALSAGRGSARVLMSEIALPLTPELQEQNTALANRLSETINSEASFAAAARRHSAAPTAGRGGRLDWVPLSNLPPQLTAQVLTLAPGQVTEPVNLGSFVALFLLRDLEELAAPPPATLAVDYAEVLIPGGRTEATLARAAQLRNDIDTCDDLYGVDIGDDAVLSRQSAQQSDLPDNLSLELAKLDSDEVSTMLSTATALRFIMLCGRSVELEEGERDQIREQLRQQRLVTYANGFLAELKADAIITLPE